MELFLDLAESKMGVKKKKGKTAIHSTLHKSIEMP